MRALGLVLALAVLVTSAPVSSRPSVHAASACQVRRRVPLRRPAVTLAERRAIRRRHVRATIGDLRRWLATRPPALDLRPLSALTPFLMMPTDDQGAFGPAALDVAEHALAYHDGTTHPIHPRLMTLVYAAVRHFRVPYVHVISGYRSGSTTSRHGLGRAIDFVLPGVSDTRLAAWLRPQGYVGVGIYPTSGFVHLDVRAHSYFWRDASGPSQRNRERPILRALAPRYDREARARGVEPVPDLHMSESEPGPEIEGEPEMPPDESVIVEESVP